MTAEDLAPPLVLVCLDSHGEAWFNFIGRNRTWWNSHERGEDGAVKVEKALELQGYWTVRSAKSKLLP